MRIEKMILYILRNNQSLNLDEVKEIIKSVSSYSESKIEEVVKKLIESYDIKEKEGNLTLMAKARRKMIKPNNKVP